jgi:hypothetical protein
VNYFDANVRTVLYQAPHPTTADELARTLLTRPEIVEAALHRLHEAGSVHPLSGGRWEARGAPSSPASTARAHAETEAEVDRLRRELARVRTERDRLLTELQVARSQRRGARAVPAGEVETWLDDLLVLCHPDRHDNDARATRVTQWLLSRRRRR